MCRTHDIADNQSIDSKANSPRDLQERKCETRFEQQAETVKGYKREMRACFFRKGTGAQIREHASAQRGATIDHRHAEEPKAAE
jgi:hypothetical protein